MYHFLCQICKSLKYRRPLKNTLILTNWLDIIIKLFSTEKFTFTANFWALWICNISLIASKYANFQLGWHYRQFPFNFPSSSPPFLSHNIPGDTFQKLSHGAVFTLCSHTFTLFWSRKRSVIVKIFQLRVYVYAFHPEISSFFGRSFPFPFLFFVSGTIVL